MGLEQNLAQEIVSFFRSSGLGSKVEYREVEKTPVADLLGFVFAFDSKGRKLDIVITPPSGDESTFSRYFDCISTGEIFSRPAFSNILENKNKSQYHLRDRKFYRDKGGKYHFVCTLNVKDDAKIFFGVLNHVIRPVLMYGRTILL
jgi:hypothetical protein